MQKISQICYGTCLDWDLRGIKSPLGLGFFSAIFTFQLYVSDSLYSQALHILSGIAFVEINKIFCRFGFYLLKITDIINFCIECPLAVHNQQNLHHSKMCTYPYLDTS